MVKFSPQTRILQRTSSGQVKNSLLYTGCHQNQCIHPCCSSKTYGKQQFIGAHFLKVLHLEVIQVSKGHPWFNPNSHHYCFFGKYQRPKWRSNKYTTEFISAPEEVLWGWKWRIRTSRGTEGNNLSVSHCFSCSCGSHLSCCHTKQAEGNIPTTCMSCALYLSWFPSLLSPGSGVEFWHKQIILQKATGMADSEIAVWQMQVLCYEADVSSA